MLGGTLTEIPRLGIEGPTATCFGANNEALVIDSVVGAEAAR